MHEYQENAQVTCSGVAGIFLPYKEVSCGVDYRTVCLWLCVCVCVFVHLHVHVCVCVYVCVRACVSSNNWWLCKLSVCILIWSLIITFQWCFLKEHNADMVSETKYKVFSPHMDRFCCLTSFLTYLVQCKLIILLVVWASVGGWTL